MTVHSRMFDTSPSSQSLQAEVPDLRNKWPTAGLVTPLLQFALFISVAGTRNVSGDSERADA